MVKKSRIDPPLSPEVQRYRDKLEAHASAPTVTSTSFESRKQSRLGKKGAAARWGGRASLDRIIQQLAGCTDALGDPLDPNELWPRLYAALDGDGANPRDLERPRRYRYEGGEITYDAFRRTVQRERQ